MQVVQTKLKNLSKNSRSRKARVDFMAEKMTLEVESGHDLEVENEARAVIGKLEPDVKVISLKDVKEEEDVIQIRIA